VRRVIAPVAAALLVLTIAGPVAADPTVQQSQFPHVYVTTCAGGEEVPDQFAHNVPGWGINWQPGDTPWLLMGYKVRLADGSDDGSVLFVWQNGMPGLVGNGRLFGPCELRWGDPNYWISDAWFLHR